MTEPTFMDKHAMLEAECVEKKAEKEKKVVDLAA